MTAMTATMVATGDVDLTFTADADPSDRDVARVLIIFSIAQIPATATLAADDPPDGHLTDAVVDDFTPIDPVVADYDAGCYNGWVPFRTFTHPSSEEMVFGSDYGFQSMVIGTSLWQYVTAKHPAGTILHLEFNGTTPEQVTSVAYLFEYARANVYLSGEPLTPMEIAGAPSWARTDWPRATTDCDGGLAQYTDVLLLPTVQTGISTGTTGDTVCGALFGYTRAVGLRAKPWEIAGSVTGLDFDEFDPVAPGGDWLTWGGTSILTDDGTVVWQRSGSPDPPALNPPWRAQWKMRLNPPAGQHSMNTQWDCPGNNTIGTVGNPRYNAIFAASAGCGIKKAGNRLPDGLAPCRRQVHITSEATLTVPAIIIPEGD